MIHEKIIGGITEYLYHRPRYTGETEILKPEAYLRLPFRYEDLSKAQIGFSLSGITKNIEYQISAGWYYSRDVTRYIPYRHAAVDFALPYGFPVAAPCDGYAISSYYSYPLLDSKGRLKQIEGKYCNFGIGYFVQIYNPEMKRFIQLGHLSDIHKSIPFSIPNKVNNLWKPTNNNLPITELESEKNPNVVSVKTGETIGYVGYSGLCYGDDYFYGHERPYQIDPQKLGTWSIPHVHMDEFMRNFVTGKKDWRRDPYDIYAWRTSYPTHTNNLPIGNEPLFITDSNNKPYYADK
jgi:hypothetical protein